MALRTGFNNHVELVHRPGEGALARKLLALLGAEPKTSPVPFEGVTFHFSTDMTIWVSEVTKEQWAFEQWLQAQLRDAGTAETEDYVRRLEIHPQIHAHFGLGATTLDEWEGTVARLRAAIADDAELKGRLTLPIVQRPEDADSVASRSAGKMGRTMYQAFLRTDILSAGLLSLGQSIEVQHYRENDPSYDGAFATLKGVPADA